MPRPSHLSPDNILRFLQVRSEPASASEIAQGLHLKKTDNRPLFKMLSKLRKRGAIEELPGGRHRLPSRKSEQKVSGQKPRQEAMRRPQPSALADRDEVKGRLCLHHHGYGFGVPDSPMPQPDCVVRTDVLRWPAASTSVVGVLALSALIPRSSSGSIVSCILSPPNFWMKRSVARSPSMRFSAPPAKISGTCRS